MFEIRKTIKNCEFCGKEFYATDDRLKYCSTECRTYKWNKYRAEYYHKNRKAILKYKAEYYRKNREIMRKRGVEYYHRKKAAKNAENL